VGSARKGGVDGVYNLMPLKQVEGPERSEKKGRWVVPALKRRGEATAGRGGLSQPKLKRVSLGSLSLVFKVKVGPPRGGGYGNQKGALFTKREKVTTERLGVCVCGAHE